MPPLSRAPRGTARRSCCATARRRCSCRLWMTVARPVAGSSCITLLASLFANSIVPLSPAMRPSALLPSHDHTTFHVWPAAITPGNSPSDGGSRARAARASSPAALGRRRRRSKMARAVSCTSRFAAVARISARTAGCCRRSNAEEGLLSERGGRGAAGEHGEHGESDRCFHESPRIRVWQEALGRSLA